ncbi:hypothetical protein P7C70_g6802, partial [Phenoliferia sp. Uapishka_3]
MPSGSPFPIVRDHCSHNSPIPTTGFTFIRDSLNLAESGLPGRWTLPQEILPAPEIDAALATSVAAESNHSTSHTLIAELIAGVDFEHGWSSDEDFTLATPAPGPAARTAAHPPRLRSAYSRVPSHSPAR